MPRTREVEYYRLWGGDHGTWDTDFIRIPWDTPDDQVEAAVRTAAAAIEWRDDDPPVIVGLYSMTDDRAAAELTCGVCGEPCFRDDATGAVHHADDDNRSTGIDHAADADHPAVPDDQ